MVVVIGHVGLSDPLEAQTVTEIANPYSEFGIGELQNAKFIGVNTPDDGFNVDMYDLGLFLDGIEVFGRSGKPTIGQAGYTGALTGTATVINAYILLWDGGALSFDNGTDLGTNALLMQSSAASGDVFDMALVFDIEDITSFPVSGELTNVYLVSDPVSGSFTMDSAIAAAAGGPTEPPIPEPSSAALLSLGGLALLMRRKRES